MSSASPPSRSTRLDSLKAFVSISSSNRRAHKASSAAAGGRRGLRSSSPVGCWFASSHKWPAGSTPEVVSHRCIPTCSPCDLAPPASPASAYTASLRALGTALITMPPASTWHVAGRWRICSYQLAWPTKSTAVDEALAQRYVPCRNTDGLWASRQLRGSPSIAASRAHSYRSKHNISQRSMVGEQPWDSGVLSQINACRDFWPREGLGMPLDHCRCSSLLGISRKASFWATFIVASPGDDSFCCSTRWVSSATTKHVNRRPVCLFKFKEVCWATHQFWLAKP